MADLKRRWYVQPLHVGFAEVTALISKERHWDLRWKNLGGCAWAAWISCQPKQSFLLYQMTAALPYLEAIQCSLKWMSSMYNNSYHLRFNLSSPIALRIMWSFSWERKYSPWSGKKEPIYWKNFRNWLTSTGRNLENMCGNRCWACWTTAGRIQGWIEESLLTWEHSLMTQDLTSWQWSWQTDCLGWLHEIWLWWPTLSEMEMLKSPCQSTEEEVSGWEVGMLEWIYFLCWESHPTIFPGRI